VPALTTPLHVLLLADDQKGAPSTIHDHIQAFTRYSRHDVRVFNPRGLARSRFLDLGEFDVVVIHYSLVVIWDDYFSKWFRDEVARYDGLKVQFLQDEYRWVDDITEAMRAMGIDVLFSVVPQENVPNVYGDRLPGVDVEFTLTGFVPENIVGRSVPPLADRPLDVGYRGRSSPFWLGRLGHEKIQIGRGFLPHAERLGLRCDIAWSESARIYGERWYDWMASCRTMLASESGSSIVDFDGAAERGVRDYLASNPTASYEEVEERVLEPYANGPAINTVSPRVFETAAMRTAMVMFPGEYSEVVRPWDHYLPLEKDFSNVDEIAERIRDLTFLEAMVERSYDELIHSGRYSYRRFVEGFDDVVAARARSTGRGGRFPAVLLHGEQLSTGRSYYVSSAYGIARQGLLVYVGTKHILRHQPLRRLALTALRRRVGAHGGGATLWDDIFRLALLTSVQEGALAPESGPFRVHASLDDGCLTLTSRPVDEPIGDGIGDAVGNAIRARELRAIVWNHAALGQFVILPLPLVRKTIGFDVGRYDAYGVYRFDQLVEATRRDPDLLLAALQPLLGDAGASHPDRTNTEDHL
jgi:hypothetical protein